MANVKLLKLRAHIAICLAVLGYPPVLLIAVLYKIYERIFCQAPLKTIAGEIAVVTGAAYGLGKDIAIELASKGCHIAIADIDLEEAEKTANYIKDVYKVNTKAYKVDVTEHEQVMQLSKDVTTDLGVATILINNAGIILIEEYGNPTWLEVQKIINTNLTSHFSTQQAFLPQMMEQRKGHIVAISSVSSFFPLIENAEYTATKYGLRGLTRVLRLNLKKSGFDNIHVTGVYPSFLDCNAEVAKLMHKVGSTHMYPIITGEETARTTVNGMLRNEKEIIIPYCFAILYRLFEMLPASWQDWILWTPAKAVSHKKQ